MARRVGLWVRCSSILMAALAPASVRAEAQPREELHVVLPFDAILAIDRPSFEPVAEAKRMAPEELVIGLVGEREQRAYSTWQLDRHEIVNDVFEGQPVAVTW